MSLQHRVVSFVSHLAFSLPCCCLTTINNNRETTGNDQWRQKIWPLQAFLRIDFPQTTSQFPLNHESGTDEGPSLRQQELGAYSKVAVKRLKVMEELYARF